MATDDHADLSPRIRAVLAHQGDYDSLNHADQAVVSEIWKRGIERRISEMDLVAEFEATGQAYAELDDDGYVVEVPARPPEQPGR